MAHNLDLSDNEILALAIFIDTGARGETQAMQQLCESALNRIRKMAQHILDVEKGNYPEHDPADNKGGRECPNCAVRDKLLRWVEEFDHKGENKLHACFHCGYQWRWNTAP